MDIVWWAWIALGLVLLGLELLTPGGFYLVFIGLAAIVTGVIAPVLPTAWLEILIFGTLSLVFVTLLRKPMVARLHKSTPKADQQEFLGETAQALEDLAPGAEGKVELRGVSWSATNRSPDTIGKGESCLVSERSGLKLIVRKP